MALIVLLGGSRNGERVRYDREDPRELRMPTADERLTERYHLTPERRDGFQVARLAARLLPAGPSEIHAGEPSPTPRPKRGHPRELTFKSLTERQCEILTRLGRGESLKAIAADLGISENTAQTHCKRAYVKLGLPDERRRRLRGRRRAQPAA